MTKQSYGLLRTQVRLKEEYSVLLIPEHGGSFFESWLLLIRMIRSQDTKGTKFS